MQRTLIAGLTVAVVALIAGCAATTAPESSPSAAPTEQPVMSELAPGTRMGAVELITDNVEELSRFYVDGIGLSELSRDETSTVLGIDGEELLRLVASDAAPDDFTQAGLYHSAFLFPDETELASALVRTISVAPDSFQGSADHRVSQAFYFGDPDGNGVELYVDRPESSWLWQDGQVVMGSEALDPNAFVANHLPADGATASAGALSMGHVHLRGGDLEQAEAFYADALGFAVTSRADGAIFLSAGGYHHHLAVNTWSSAGAGARPASLGLSKLSVLVPDAAELASVDERLTAVGVAVQRGENSLTASDPWGTRVEISVAQ